MSHTLCIIAVWAMLVKNCSSLTAYSLQPDFWKVSRDDVYLKMNFSKLSEAKTIPIQISSISICYRLKISQFTFSTIHFSYATSDTSDNVLVMYSIYGGHHFRFNNKPQPQTEAHPLILALHEWHHFCHIISNQTYKFLYNGELIAEGPLVSSQKFIKLNGTLIIGQEQDSLSGKFSRTQVLRGYIIQFNIWDYDIGNSVISVAKCQSNMNGNIFSTELDAFEKYNVNSHQVQLSELCNHQRGFIVFPHQFSFFQTVDMCSKVNSSMYVPKSAEENLALHNTVMTFDSCKHTFNVWIGATDDAEESVWRDVTTNLTLTYNAFNYGQPDDSRLENCVVTTAGSGFWSDYGCDVAVVACAACKHIPGTYLTLRGMCADEESYTFFEVLGYQNRKPYFHGFYGLMIIYDTLKRWALVDLEKNQTIAVLVHSSDEVYPIGKHTWTVESSFCKQNRGTPRLMSFSICNQEEFMCNDGSCIPLKNRCDNKDDCADQSDEDNCSLLVLTDAYRNFKPPINPNDKYNILRPIVKVEVIRFLTIQDVDQAIDLEFRIRVSWIDNRLKYTNLRRNIAENKLSEQEIHEIWKPNFEFPNVKDGGLQLLNENIYINRTGESETRNFNDVSLDIVYSGDSAFLVEDQHYSGSFVCTFDVFYYPFDEQSCTLVIKFNTVSKAQVVFSNNRSKAVYNGPLKFKTFAIGEFSTRVLKNGARESHLEVRYILLRQNSLIILSVYLPSFLLLFVGYATLYVKLPQLEVRLTVSLTTKLVLYTLFNQTSSTLPRTAYVKMIDGWFLFCILLLFTNTLFHVLVSWVDDAERHMSSVAPYKVPFNMKKTSRVDKLLFYVRSAIPAITLTFLICYCIATVYH